MRRELRLLLCVVSPQNSDTLAKPIKTPMHPSSDKFTQDLRSGEHAEAIVARVIAQRVGGIVHFNPPGREGRWDFKIERRQVKAYEAKVHLAHEKTGRLFMEVSCSGKPSGLKTTACDWWVDIAPPSLIFMSKPASLLSWLEATSNLIRGGDSNRTEGYLVSSVDMKTLSETCPEWCMMMTL